MNLFYGEVKLKIRHIEENKLQTKLTTNYNKQHLKYMPKAKWKWS